MKTQFLFFAVESKPPTSTALLEPATCVITKYGYIATPFAGMILDGKDQGSKLSRIHQALDGLPWRVRHSESK